MKKFSILLLFLAACMFVIPTNAQEVDEDLHKYKPLKLSLNEDGSKYVRFITWHQIWATTSNLSAEDSKAQLNFSMRRSRFLAFAQVSPKFMILMHWGLNSLTPGNQTSLGNNGDSPQMFLHDAWGELKLSNDIYIGAGLHYWKGLTRQSNTSTLNLLTMDQPRPFVHWHSLGITDQFARHLGVYLKGAPADGKLEYRLAFNNPGRAPLGSGKDYSGSFDSTGAAASDLTYTGVSSINSDGDPTGNMVVEGYLKYNLWDKEGTKLPFYPGTYLGKKKLLSFGAGFYLHPNGMYNNATLEHSGVTHLALDGILELPTDAGSLSAYASFINFNYGENYISRWGGTGNSIYGQLGYLIKDANIMPYVSVNNSSFEAADDPVMELNAGLNYYVNGHNAKITAEYHLINKDYREGAIVPGVQDNLSQIRVQLHIFL